MGADGSAGRVWSPMQQAIFAHIEDPMRKHLVVEALAGTGKSTTIEEAVRRTDPDASVLVCAFNAAIVKALEPRMPDGVVVSTFHSFGLRAVRGVKSVEVNRFRTADLAQGIFGRSFETKQARDFVTKLVGIAKGQAFDALAESKVIGTKFALLDSWADAFSLDVPRGWDRRRLVGSALEILRSSQQRIGAEIDFDDMIWLPCVLGLSAPTFAFVFVDETQDLNPAQLKLAVAAAGESGRIVAVGDRHQAIYGFRGADREAIPRMIRELSADVLPLSVTYRCAKRIVAEANAFVPALEAASGAAPGVVRWASEEELERAVAPGDFVLSRTNAPLVSLCFRLIASGRRAAIQGRDIGDGLTSWVKSAKASSVPELQGALGRWRAAEIARLEEAERDTEAVTDRAECLMAIMSGAESIDMVLRRIEAIFSGEAPGSRVLLSSTHRAKGLEAERVWILRDTYLRRPGDEEENLLYVAITRAKAELIYVTENPDDCERDGSGEERDALDDEEDAEEEAIDDSDEVARMGAKGSKEWQT